MQALEVLEFELRPPEHFSSVEVFAPEDTPNAEFETMYDGLYHLRLQNVPLYTIVFLKPKEDLNCGGIYDQSRTV